MDIRTLEVLLVLSEELHFRRAAERLGMTQSSVSDHIRKLENRLQRTLFDRTSRRVVLTEAGEILVHRLRDPVHAIKVAIQDAQRDGPLTQESLRVGFMGGGFYELHEPLVNYFRNEHPEIALEFVEVHYDNQFLAILHGDVDVGFCRLPVGLPGLEVGPIVMSDPRVVCVSANHRLADRDHIDAEELRGETMLRAPASRTGTKWAEYHFPLTTPEGHRLNAGPTVRTVREGIAAVVAGSGIFLLTKRAANYYATPRIRYVEVNLPPIQSALVWRQDGFQHSISLLSQALLKVASNSDR